MPDHWENQYMLLSTQIRYRFKYRMLPFNTAFTYIGRRHCVVVLEQDTFILAKYWFNPGRLVLV